MLQPPYRRILILKECCIGDLLMTTPILRAVRKTCPDARIDLAVGPFARPAVANNPHVDDVIEYPRIWNPRNDWSLRRRLTYIHTLRQRRYDLILCFEMGSRIAIICRMIGAPVRVGFNWKGEGLFHNRRIHRRPNDAYAVDVYMRALEAAGLPHDGYELEFFPGDSARQRAASLLPETRHRPVVALAVGGGENPGASMPIKRWHARHYAALADRLVEDFGATIVLIGGASDQEPADQVATAMRTAPINLIGACSLDETGAVLQRADLFVGNDSGPLHLAIACGTPTVGVFGPTDPRLYLPPSEKVIGATAGIDCSPCHKTMVVGAWTCTNPNVLECMDRVLPEQVLSHCAQLLRPAGYHGTGSAIEAAKKTSG